MIDTQHCTLHKHVATRRKLVIKAEELTPNDKVESPVPSTTPDHTVTCTECLSLGGALDLSFIFPIKALQKGPEDGIPVEEVSKPFVRLISSSGLAVLLKPDDRV